MPDEKEINIKGDLSLVLGEGCYVEIRQEGSIIIVEGWVYKLVIYPEKKKAYLQQKGAYAPSPYTSSL